MKRRCIAIELTQLTQADVRFYSQIIDLFDGDFIQRKCSYSKVVAAASYCK